MTASIETPRPAAAQATRDPWFWPFAADSIWNTPVGDGANYAAANIDNGWDTSIDHEWFIRTTNADPFRTLYYPGPNDNRDAGTAVSWLGSMRVPDSLIIPDSYPGYTPNDCSTFLQPDGSSIIQLQPTTRSSAGGAIWGFPQTDWGGDPNEGNLYGQGERGTHYGSGLSAIGGSIRVGELTGANPIRHALKVNLWGRYYYYRDANGVGQHRWPARNADGYASAPVEEGGYGGTNAQLMPGSLLAIPRTWTHSSVGGLESEVGRKLFDALQRFGAYVVDDSAWYTNALCAEKGVDEEVLERYGHRLTGPQSGSGSNPVSRDMGKLFRALHVVTNNSPTSKGGPGSRLAPGAPPFGSGAPVGAVVGIRSRANGLFVSADLNDGVRPLRAGWATTVQGWERFRIDDAGNGEVALFSLGANCYVTMDDGRADKLLQAGGQGQILGWERFRWKALGGNRFALRSVQSGGYVTANLGDGGRLRAQATNLLGWEEFEYTPM